MNAGWVCVCLLGLPTETKEIITHSVQLMVVHRKVEV